MRGIPETGFSCLLSSVQAEDKKWQTEHRTATTAYPCCLPALGEFSRSWSCRFAEAKLIKFLRCELIEVEFPLPAQVANPGAIARSGEVKLNGQFGRGNCVRHLQFVAHLSRIPYNHGYRVCAKCPRTQTASAAAGRPGSQCRAGACRRVVAECGGS